MTEKNNATCSICGKGYYMCLSCKDMMNLNPWKKHTDTSEHYKIYQILHGYSTGVYNKEEAKSKLQKVDLSDFDSLRDNIKCLINTIMAEAEMVVETVVEEAEAVAVKKPKTTRKRKSSKVVETE